MEIVIDGHGHILGRLASICSKELLKGQRLVFDCSAIVIAIVRLLVLSFFPVIVRCQNICMSGGIIRQKMKYHRALRRRRNTNPRRGGPKIQTSPSGILARVIKGMLPRSKRAGALRNFKAYDGCPPPYGVVKKMVIPDALKVLRMRRESPFCLLGALARDLGWEGGAFVAKLEAKRKEKPLVFYKRKLKFLAERSRILDEYDKKQNELQQQQENLLEETGRILDESDMNQRRQQEKLSEGLQLAVKLPENKNLIDLFVFARVFPGYLSAITDVLETSRFLAFDTTTELAVKPSEAPKVFSMLQRVRSLESFAFHIDVGYEVDAEIIQNVLSLPVFGELKELVIEGFEIQGEIKLIPLPSFVELNVKGFIIAPEMPHPGIAWPLLTTLELFYMLVSPITVNGILARCPSLTNLSMIECIYYVDFDNEDDTDDDAPMTSAFSVEWTIFSTSLTSFRFKARGEIYDEIKIIAPSLKKLNLSGFQNLKLEGPFALAEMSLSEIDFEEESLSIMQEQLNSITSKDPSVTEVLRVSTVGDDSGRLYAVLRSIVGITTTVLEVQGSPALLDNIDHLQVWESIRTYARTVNLVPAEVD